MVQINNTEIRRNITEATGILDQKAPVELDSKVVSVIETNPRIIKHSNIFDGVVKTATAAATIYTTPADDDFFLTSVTLSWNKDVTCDATSVRVTAYTPAGFQATPVYVTLPSLTAQSGQIVVPFSYPLKLQRNSIITCVGAFTAGAMTEVAQITGYCQKSLRA